MGLDILTLELPHLYSRLGNIRVVQKLLGHKSIKTTEIYSHLSDKHLHSVICMLPGPNLGTALGTPKDFVAPEIPQVVDNKVVGDTGFEPVTSTVCKRHKKTKKRII